MLAILKGMSWYLLVFLICSSLMVYDMEHLSICLFAISVSSLARYLFISFVHFLLDVSFLLMNFKNSLYILDYRAFIRYIFCKYFLPDYGSSCSLDGVFLQSRSLKRMESSLSIISFMDPHHFFL